jgi:hypothetical protein
VFCVSHRQYLLVCYTGSVCLCVSSWLTARFVLFLVHVLFQLKVCTFSHKEISHKNSARNLIKEPVIRVQCNGYGHGDGHGNGSGHGRYIGHGHGNGHGNKFQR